MIHLGDFQPDETVYLPLEFAPTEWAFFEDGREYAPGFPGRQEDMFGAVIPCAALTPGRQYAAFLKGKKPGGKATYTETVLFSVGRTVLPEPFPKVVAADVVTIAGEAPPLHKGRLEVHAKSYAAFPKGQLSNEAFGPDALTGAKIAQNAFGPKQLGEETIRIIQDAVVGQLDTDTAGRVRIVSGTGPGEINIEHGAIKRVMQNDDTPPKAPDITPLVQALDDVKVALTKLATIKQLDAIPRVRAEDIVTNGPIQTVAGQVVQVARVNEVDVVTGSVARVTGNVQGNVAGTVGHVNGDVKGSIGEIGEHAQQQIEALVNHIWAYERREEPGLGAPDDNAAWGAKLDWLYKAWRNKKATTAKHEVLFNTDGATPDQTANVYTRDGITYRDTIDVGNPDALKPKK